MKIAVIGGSGFIGTRLTARLLERGDEVVILDKERSATYPDLWRRADVREPESLREGLAGCETIINLAAEHKDNVSPRSLYDQVNVDGARNVCDAARALGIDSIIFTSSVAVYGFAPPDTGEDGEFNPFNDYGRTKAEAEVVYRAWQNEEPGRRALTVVRPTVVFGERNRGNVYNLLRQIAGGRFMMVGDGTNVKSMAYVENVAAFLEHSLSFGAGQHTYNYIDKPDLDMNGLVAVVRRELGQGEGAGLRIPTWIGLAGGRILDLLSHLTGREFPISAIRVKKFVRTTQFASAAHALPSFQAPVSIEEGIRRTVAYEFLRSEGSEGERGEEVVFYSE